MRRKQKEIRFEEEASKLVVGQQVPLSCRYCLGTSATLLALDGETAILVFPNGDVRCHSRNEPHGRADGRGTRIGDCG